MPVESTVRSRSNHTFGLIETLRYEPGQGCIRAGLHLDRLKNSARHFHRNFPAHEAASLLSTIASETPLRVRLFLDPDDNLTCTTHDFTPINDVTIWKLAIAKTKLDSMDMLLAHKTSRRDQYDAARAEFSAGDADEVLMENESGFLCEGTITSLFVSQEGIFVTPRLSHGLLRGILRQEMLDNGQAIEGNLKRRDLIGAEVFVGNSLRGLIPAKLIESA